MPLLLLLTLLGESDKKRVLIDTLLHVESRSAAAIARAAGVAPAALSNLRKENGIGQISQEGQDRVLAALGWPGGNPNPNVTFRWKVKDLAALGALKWLLDEKFKSGMKLFRLRAIDHDEMSSQFPVLLGKFNNATNISSISFHALDQQVQSGFEGLWNELDSSEKMHSIEVPMDSYEAIYRGAVTVTELKRLVEGRSESEDNELDPKIIAQFRFLGLTKKEHHQLLIDWLAKSAVSNSKDLARKLRTLDRLNFPESEIRPSEMTELQMEKFVLNIAHWVAGNSPDLL